MVSRHEYKSYPSGGRSQSPPQPVMRNRNQPAVAAAGGGQYPSRPHSVANGSYRKPVCVSLTSLVSFILSLGVGEGGGDILHCTLSSLFLVYTLCTHPCVVVMKSYL